MTSYSDSGYQDSSVSYYSNQNVVRSEPRASISRSPRAEGQASGQVGHLHQTQCKKQLFLAVLRGSAPTREGSSSALKHVILSLVKIAIESL